MLRLARPLHHADAHAQPFRRSAEWRASRRADRDLRQAHRLCRRPFAGGGRARGITLVARRRTDGVVRVGDIFDGRGRSRSVAQRARSLPRHPALCPVVAHRFFLNFLM
jgi:hypothetical protein